MRRKIFSAALVRLVRQVGLIVVRFAASAVAQGMVENSSAEKLVEERSRAGQPRWAAESKDLAEPVHLLIERDDRNVHKRRRKAALRSWYKIQP